MLETILSDRPFIDNKYHKTNEPFDSFARMAYHGWDYDPSETDETILATLDKLTEETKTLPHPVAKARAFAYILDHTPVRVNAHDPFVGIYAWGRLLSRSTVGRWHDEIFNDPCAEANAFMNQSRAAGICDMWPDYDHSVPEWDDILNLGFRGLLDRAMQYKQQHAAEAPLNPEQLAYFDGIEITYLAILRLVDRLYETALAQPHPRGPEVAACMGALRTGAPATTYQALQTMYLYFILCECVDNYQVRSIGNGLDNTLLSFYTRDLKQGTYTEDQLDAYIGYFLLQFSAIGNYWGHPLYLGGTNLDGSTRYNTLSYRILDVYDKLGLYNPKLQLKLNDNTPRKLRDKALDMIRRGENSIVFVCEPCAYRAMARYGVSAEEARSFDISGCYEMRVRGNENVTGTIYFNMLQPVSTALRDESETFDGFYAAYKSRAGHLLERCMETADAYEPYLAYINPANMLSAVSRTSLETMRDGYATGVKYNNTAALCCGFASVVDALVAVRELVYTRHIITCRELSSVLDADWDGHEELRRTTMNLPKYGNDDPAVDTLAADLAGWYTGLVNNRPNARGGVYKSILHTALHFKRFGERTGATPDGRHAGDETSKNASPSVGMDRHGVTALVNSALKLQPDRFPESFCVDLMLHRSAAEGERGLDVLNAVLDTYLCGGGFSIQFNIADAQILRDAQAHPERYGGLQVRVCGWNALWVTLPLVEQDAYILRAESI